MEVDAGDMKKGAGNNIKMDVGKSVASLFALCARSSFYKILAVFAGLAIAEGVSFYVVCMRLEQGGEAPYQGVISPERMIDLCLLKYIFLAALILVAVILIVTERDRSGCKSSYTLLRLKVSKKQQFAVKTVYNFLCLMMVFALQILAAFIICRIYEARLPSELVSPQYLFLVFYRNKFLHCILPMADAGKWACNFLLLLALAMDAAYVRNRDGNGSESSGYGRRKRAGGNAKNGLVLPFINYYILSQWFVTEINSPVVLIYALYCAAIIAIVLLRLFGVIGGKDEEA